MSGYVPPEDRPCYKGSIGNEPLVTEPGEHEWQHQPFYNQDWRLWCRRCWLLITPTRPFEVAR